MSTDARAAYRYFTTHALTGEVLARDLPLSGVSFGPELNGPGQMRATLAPASRTSRRARPTPATPCCGPSETSA
ncbi:hypothetical protein ACFQ0T_29225 [Kitasatospora gansuensis]